MKAISRAANIIGPAIVLGAILFFVYYSLVIYKPNGTVACQKLAVARQVDVAVNVVRQWFGRESGFYNACPKTNH